MKVNVDSTIEVLGRTLKPFDHEHNRTGDFFYYLFQNGKDTVTICVQAFLETGNAASSMVRGKFTRQEYEVLNFNEHVAAYGTLVPMHELDEELEFAITEIINPELVTRPNWGNKLLTKIKNGELFGIIRSSDKES